MSLERKDIRAKLDPDMHEALAALCEAEEIDLGEFVERELVRVIKQRVHAATVIVERLARRGKPGSNRE
jgi:predicted HicB family RNase H-like nuclease